ncbi:MAG: hypothetical protein EWV86_22965 [Microcystis panniformis Mp_MB_F_20051200_S9D]|nr:MAG: hypothetical protein EWV86_22965 [Microcystis panniformis Mp_MB_F_20051200_S9D]
MSECFAPTQSSNRTLLKTRIEFAREKFGVRAKHSDRKSRVSVIGYCPNASPLLNHLTKSAPY